MVVRTLIYCCLCQYAELLDSSFAYKIRELAAFLLPSEWAGAFCAGVTSRGGFQLEFPPAPLKEGSTCTRVTNDAIHSKIW